LRHEENNMNTIAVGLLLYINAGAYQSPFIGDQQVFPSDNPWNWDISGYAVHPNSDNFVNSVGASTSLHPDFGAEWNGVPNGIPYVVVSNSDPLVPVTFAVDGVEDDAYGDESDPGPYRIPLDAPIEGGPVSRGDRHVIAIDTSSDSLYELYYAFPKATFWEAMSGAIYNLSANDHHPDNWTSADAAGLPIFPGLVRYEEAVVKGEINHAIRITVSHTQRAYIFPARHYASSSTNENYPPMGLRFRLKADFDISGFDPVCQVILCAMKKHGLIVADNGSDWYISGAPDERWDDDVLNTLKAVKGSDLEAVLTVDGNGDPIFPSGTHHRVRTDIQRRMALPQKGTLQIYDLAGRRISADGGLTRLEPGVCIVAGKDDGDMHARRFIRLVFRAW